VEERTKVVARAGGCCAASTRGTTTRAPLHARLRGPRARGTRRACPTGRWRSSPRPRRPASIGFIAARIAEARDGTEAYRAERARQVAWLAERLGL
jgi:hypothetical protein